MQGLPPACCLQGCCIKATGHEAITGESSIIKWLNLLAASASTLGTLLATTGLFVTAHSGIKWLEAIGGAVATIGGVAWIIAAIIDIVGGRGRT